VGPQAIPTCISIVGIFLFPLFGREVYPYIAKRLSGSPGGPTSKTSTYRDVGAFFVASRQSKYIKIHRFSLISGSCETVNSSLFSFYFRKHFQQKTFFLLKSSGLITYLTSISWVYL